MDVGVGTLDDDDESLGKTNSTQTSKGEYHDYYDDKKNGTQRRLNEDDTNDTNN